MWADTLFAFEQAHVLGVFAWGALSTLTATAVLALLAARHERPPLLKRFALFCLAFGVTEVAGAALGWARLALRDYEGAVQLRDALQLNVAVAAAIFLAGAALLLAARALGRRTGLDAQGLVGAGVALLVHGAALLVLDGRFLAIVSRSVR